MSDDTKRLLVMLAVKRGELMSPVSGATSFLGSFVTTGGYHTFSYNVPTGTTKMTRVRVR